MMYVYGLIIIANCINITTCNKVWHLDNEVDNNKCQRYKRNISNVK